MKLLGIVQIHVIALFLKRGLHHHPFHVEEHFTMILQRAPQATSHYPFPRNSTPQRADDDY